MIWTDGLLVEACIAVAEIANHPQAHALRAALAQAAVGLDTTKYESPLDKLSIRHYLTVELDPLLETADVWSTVRHYLDEQQEDAPIVEEPESDAERDGWPHGEFDDEASWPNSLVIDRLTSTMHRT